MDQISLIYNFRFRYALDLLLSVCSSLRYPRHSPYSCCNSQKATCLTFGWATQHSTRYLCAIFWPSLCPHHFNRPPKERTALLIQQHTLTCSMVVKICSWAFYRKKFPSEITKLNSFLALKSPSNKLAAVGQAPIQIGAFSWSPAPINCSGSRLNSLRDASHRWTGNLVDARCLWNSREHQQNQALKRPDAVSQRIS